MKQSLQCPKCESRDVVCLEHVADAAGTEEDDDSDFRHAGKPGTSVRRHLAMQKSPWKLTCPLVAYVCGACGYVEEYAVGVGEVDWDDVIGASRPRGALPDDGPFRS